MTKRAIGLIKIVMTFSVVMLMHGHAKALGIPHNDDSVTYYQSFGDYLGVYLYAINKYNRFSLHDIDTEKEIAYNPNERFNIGIGFNYQWIGLGVSFNLGGIGEDDKYGKTERIDLQADFFSKKMVYALNFEYYKGFYWENSDFNDLGPSINIRPDLKSFGLAMSALYSFNYNKYSFKAVVINNEWQQRSAGTLLLGGGFSVYGVRGDSAVVPSFVEPGFDTLKMVRQVSTFNFGANAGYAHTFVIRQRWFATLVLIMGPSLQVANGTDDDNETLMDYTGIGVKAKSYLALGYANQKHYFGFSASNDSYLVQTSNSSQFEYSFGKIKLFYGRRFKVK